MLGDVILEDSALQSILTLLIPIDSAIDSALYDFPYDYRIYHFIWALTANVNHAYRKANSVFFTRRRADDDKSLCVGICDRPA